MELADVAMQLPYVFGSRSIQGKKYGAEMSRSQSEAEEVEHTRVLHEHAQALGKQVMKDYGSSKDKDEDGCSATATFFQTYVQNHMTKRFGVDQWVPCIRDSFGVFVDDEKDRVYFADLDNRLPGGNVAADLPPVPAARIVSVGFERSVYPHTIDDCVQYLQARYPNVEHLWLYQNWHSVGSESLYGYVFQSLHKLTTLTLAFAQGLRGMPPLGVVSAEDHVPQGGFFLVQQSGTPIQVVLGTRKT